MLLILALVSASVALLFWFLEYAPFAIDVPTDATVKPKSNMSTLMLSWFAAISLVVSSIVGVFFVLRGNFSLRLSPGSAPAVNDHGEPGFAWAPEETGPAPVLDAGERRAIRWGIGKVQTDRTLCLLNVPRTVNESARAGYPMPRFQRLRMDREIWLWRDRRVDHEAALTLFEELRTDLGRSGLPLRLGFFNGLPRHIEMDGRAEVDCFNLEYTGREAIVLVLTDGAGLVELAGSHQGRKRLERLVRDLSAWPRLTLVDFSTPDLDLAGLARSLGLNCVAPTQLARWMTEQPLIPSSARTGSEMAVDTLGGDAELLAALCALGPERPITPRQIAALSQAIGGSGVRPPRLPGARECATGVLLDAATRQNLLARLGVHGCDPKWAPRLAQARGFWRDRLEASNSAEVDMESGSDIRSVGASGLRPWLNSPGQHMLRVESLLLGLWDQGEAPQSAKDLHRLFQIPRLGKLIQRRLAKLDAAGIAEPYGARISLPWAWADLRELPGEPSGSTRWRLYQMGFAGRQLETGSRDITARIVLGLLIGIALAGFVGVIRVLLSFSQ